MIYLTIVTTVIVMAISFAVGLTGMVRFIRKLRYRNQFHEFTFAPLTSMTLPHRAARHFERYAPQIELLSFRRIGDFQLQPHPCPAVSRFFISRDGRIFGGLDDFEGMRTYSFFSVLEDGTFLETAKSRQIAEPPGVMNRLRFVCVAGGSPEEVYRKHCESLEELEQEHGPAVVYSPQQFREVVSYGHRLVHCSLFHQGLVSAPPTPETVETIGV